MMDQLERFMLVASGDELTGKTLGRNKTCSSLMWPLESYVFTAELFNSSQFDAHPLQDCGGMSLLQRSL